MRKFLRQLFMPRDERDMREFLAKMRGLGVDPQEGLQIAAMLAACGATKEQAQVYAKISAQNVLTLEAVNQLAKTGIGIVFMEKKNE